MDAVLNPEKGEVGIRLDGGRLFAMLPDMRACNAIESQVGSVIWMWLRFTRREWFPTYHEMAVVVTECIRSAARDRNDELLSKVSAEVIEKQLYGIGVLVTDPFAELLEAMCTGGATKKKLADDASSTQSATIASPTAS